jgi:endonuclease YncB( thermonuclease family)
MIRTTLAVLALALLVALPATAQQKPDVPPDCGALPAAFEGIAFADDGSTIHGVGYAPTIRLWGVRAPELHTKDDQETWPGMTARARIEDILTRTEHKVRCLPARWDRSCRVVAHCTAGATDIGLALITAGFAYGINLADTKPETVARSLEYANAEFEARKARKGFWPQWMGDQ